MTGESIYGVNLNIIKTLDNMNNSYTVSGEGGLIILEGKQEEEEEEERESENSISDGEKYLKFLTFIDMTDDFKVI